MLWVIIVFCIVVIVVGIVLVRGSSKRSVFKTHGVELDAPAGSGLIAVALFVIAYSYSMNTRLSAEKKGIEDNLAKTQTDLASTKNDLKLIEESLEQQKAETKHLESENAELEKKLANEQTERRDAEKQMIAAWKTVDQVQLTHTQKEEFDRLKDGVLKLNEKLTMLRISVAHFPRIENRKAMATFEIYRKAFEPDQNRPRGAGLFNFNSREYEIRMISGNQEGIPDKLKSEFIDVICEAARRAAINQISLSGAIDSIAPLKGYDINRPVVAQLTEFTYIQMRLRMMAAEVLVLVRGYADGELSPWQEPLKKPFSNILVHENIDPNSPEGENGLVFREQQTPISIGQVEENRTRTCDNKDLPNLRGAEAAAILKTLVDCSGQTPNTDVGSIAVEILEGRVYPEHNEVDRTARVHLLVSLKSH
jgi:regulator of replication initiation timing